VDDASALFSDDVTHNRSSSRELEESPKGSHKCAQNCSSPRELEESPKGSNDSAPQSSHVEHHEVHEVSIESEQVQTDTADEHEGALWSTSCHGITCGCRTDQCC